MLHSPIAISLNAARTCDYDVRVSVQVYTQRGRWILGSPRRMKL